MDREYLEDYEEKELDQFKRLEKRIKEGEFDFEKERYPPDNRFLNLRKPVALGSFESANIKNLWAEVPFCGSLILRLPPLPKSLFEEVLFETLEIPEIINFIKETGRLQIVFNHNVREYEGLDHFDPFFKELQPAVYFATPPSIFGNKKEIQRANASFLTLGRVRYRDFLREKQERLGSLAFKVARSQLNTYIFLKLNHYVGVEELENLMIDNPEMAFLMLQIYGAFIFDPVLDLRSSLMNYSIEELKEACIHLPLVHHPQEIRFPCEIGKFLIKKLTNAPLGLRACYDIIDHYEAYDLQKVQESLNEAIVTRQPDIVNRNAEELSEILDNVWNDPSIPKRIRNIRRGVPMLIAAIGTMVSALTGDLEGFLAGLGFSVGSAFLKADIERLSEKAGRFFAKRNYQANVYDFKKKYKDRIVRTQKKEQD